MWMSSSPTSFSFPNIGKNPDPRVSYCLPVGSPTRRYPRPIMRAFAFTGLFTFFGDPNVAIPFLLNLLRIPSDTYGYFPMVDNLVGARFRHTLAAMYTLALACLRRKRRQSD